MPREGAPVSVASAVLASKVISPGRTRDCNVVGSTGKSFSAVDWVVLIGGLTAEVFCSMFWLHEARNIDGSGGDN